ncbi:hypothetical protein AND_010392 [Anopheles darlingi]|uniref:Uncharacterized protein n=1 Tax=Anopheles darlingi TaxID=43151 RepID=W5J5I8_ANODA|nr:hypothetical protein AND_010392 [Anopheles darlingi]
MAFYKEVYKRTALLDICISERLLSEHQAVLESIVKKMPEVPDSSYWLQRYCFSVVTAAGCAGMIIPSLLGCSRSRLIAVAGLAVPIIAGTGYYNRKFNTNITAVVSFLCGIDMFHVAADQVFIHFDEMSSYENELLRTAASRALSICVCGMRDVVEHLYDLGKSLESYTDLAKEYDHMYGLLEAREYFCDQSTVENEPEQLFLNAKKQRKVLLYLQSMCLYRMGLAIASGSDLGKARITLYKATIFLKQLSKEMKSNLLPIPQESTLQATVASKQVELLKTRTQAVTANVTATHVLLTTLMNTLDEVANNPLRGNNHLLQCTATLLSEIRENTEHRLQTIADMESDVARLFVPKKSHAANTTEQRIIEFEEGIEYEITIDGSVPDTMPAEDEFFLHTASALDSASPAGVDTEHDNEEPPAEPVDRSTKRNYRKVLNQLHGKLKPIKQEFKKREQRALQRKGITTVLDHVAEDEEENDGSDSDTITISSLSSDDEYVACKPTNYQQRYNDAKEELATKPQINLFPDGCAPIVSTGEEDILE